MLTSTGKLTPRKGTWLIFIYSSLAGVSWQVSGMVKQSYLGCPTLAEDPTLGRPTAFCKQTCPVENSQPPLSVDAYVELLLDIYAYSLE